MWSLQFKATSPHSAITNVSVWDKMERCQWESGSCKTCSFGVMFETPEQKYCVLTCCMFSGNRRGGDTHTMWPFPSDNRKFPSCWQGASMKGGQLVLALHQEELCIHPDCGKQTQVSSHTSLYMFRSPNIRPLVSCDVQYADQSIMYLMITGDQEVFLQLALISKGQSSNTPHS